MDEGTSTTPSVNVESVHTQSSILTCGAHGMLLLLARQPKIGQFGAELMVKKYVGRLQVAVYKRLGVGVQEGEGARDARRDRQLLLLP